MSQPLDQLRTILRDHGQSLTAGRRLVFETLLQSEPLSMAEIITACGHQADRASIYRTVALFERLAIIHRLQIGWKYKLELSDSFSHHHHHLSCTVCGRVIPLPEDDDLEARLLGLAEAHGFVAEAHQLEIRGRCRQCHSGQ